MPGVVGSDDDRAETLTLPYWETSAAFWFFRVAGAILAPFLFFEVGPAWMVAPETGVLVWGTLRMSVAVIIPIGAIFINLFVESGGLEFVGTMARPIMRPLFHVLGRAALDSVASWVGSYVRFGLLEAVAKSEEGGTMSAPPSEGLSTDSNSPCSSSGRSSQSGLPRS